MAMIAPLVMKAGQTREAVLLLPVLMGSEQFRIAKIADKPNFTKFFLRTYKKTTETLKHHYTNNLLAFLSQYYSSELRPFSNTMIVYLTVYYVVLLER